jgi:hypothetical protein
MDGDGDLWYRYMVYGGSDDDCVVVLLLWDGEMMDSWEDDVF